MALIGSVLAGGIRKLRRATYAVVGAVHYILSWKARNVARAGQVLTFVALQEHRDQVRSACEMLSTVSTRMPCRNEFPTGRFRDLMRRYLRDDLAVGIRRPRAVTLMTSSTAMPRVSAPAGPSVRLRTCSRTFNVDATRFATPTSTTR